MPTKEDLRTAIQSRRVARGLGVLNVPTETKGQRQEMLTPQEEERRRLRRERNKQAANRCRKRKRDKIERLEKTAQEIEASNRALESNIADMKAELADLKEVLQSHDCMMATAAGNNKALVNGTAPS